MRKIAGGNGDFEFGDEEDIFSTVSEFGVTESGDYNFYLRDSDGCLDTITERVEVYGKPQLEQGVYVYVIELAGEKVEIINGTITIVR